MSTSNPIFVRVGGHVFACCIVFFCLILGR